MSLNLTEIILKKLLENFSYHFLQNFDLWHHFGPQNDPILTSFWPILSKLTLSIRILTQIHVHKPNWKNFKTFGGIFWPFWPLIWPNFDHFDQKLPFLSKFTPLMTLLTKFMSINLTEIIFKTFYRKCFDHFPQLFIYGVILAPKMTQYFFYVIRPR